MRRVAAIALVAGAIAVMALSYHAMSHGGGRSASFPNAYVPARGGLAEVRIKRAALAEAGPVEVEGIACWPAYQCLNEGCPGRGPDGRSFVFAYGATAPPSGGGPFAQCPRCAGRPDTDPTMITPYRVDEALAEMPTQ
jgi:hypothetical protein